MPYQPRIGVVRSTHVVFRLAPREVEAVDKARNGTSRSEYIRGLVKRDLEERGIR